jgi:hypothetical protein
LVELVGDKKLVRKATVVKTEPVVEVSLKRKAEDGGDMPSKSARIDIEDDDELMINE